MNEEIMNFDIPSNNSSVIKVIGVGGGGSNAVNYMWKQGIKDVDFIVCNTDSQALSRSPIAVKILLGETLTKGRGAGKNNPDVGRQAAIENLDDVLTAIGTNTNMVFITAGMGGGTGTGAAPIIAKAAKDAGILTVAIVTLPFKNEGKVRIDQALAGVEEISKYVDSLIVINNEKLREIYGNLKLSEAFSRADNVLCSAAKGIAEIITVPGYINVDFADVYSVMAKSGMAIMGSAVASGEGRAINAMKEALSSPLLNNNDITGAKNILINVASGEDEVSMDELSEITDYLSKLVNKEALIIWGTSLDESLKDNISVTVIATGFDNNVIPELHVKKNQKEIVTTQENQLRNDFNQINGSFEIKEKKIEKQIFNFDNELDTFDNLDKNIEKNALATTVITNGKTIREAHREAKDPKKLNQTIEELENIPSFKRKNIKIENQAEKKENSTISRFTLFDDGKGIKLNENNSYLHDNVD